MPRTEEVYQQIRDERVDQILQVAAKVFIQKGLANSKIGDLAEAAGMSQGLLYRYFANKEEVFTTLVEQYVGTMLQQIREVLQLSGSPYQRLYWLTERMLQSIRSQPSRHQIILQALTQPGRPSALVQEMSSFMQTNLRQLLVAGQASGEICQNDPDQLVVLYLCSMQGLASGLYFFADHAVENFPAVTTILHMFTP
jgi:AcrR family transcriptional regulator